MALILKSQIPNLVLEHIQKMQLMQFIPTEENMSSIN